MFITPNEEIRMSLRNGKVKTNQDTIDEEVKSDATDSAKASEETAEETPFDTGVPADSKEKEKDTSKKETKTREVDKSESREVAVNKPQAAPIVTQPQKGGMLAEMADTGFEGLELGYGSFPLIALKNDGVFEDTEGGEYDQDFKCIIQQTKTKYILKNTKCEKEDEAMAYSYDGKNDVHGVPLQETIDEWAEDGWGYESKTYLEVTVLMVNEDGEVGNMALLSVPPTSKTKLSGYIAQNRMRRGLMPNQYVTTCEVGDKVKNVTFPFYPWKFIFDQEV